MTRTAYLTIDDSPSATSDELTEFLSQTGVPALLFCRGDRLAENPAPAIRAIERGLILANHAYSHRRASTLNADEMKEEILQTEELIDSAYKRAGKSRPFKAFRFPHMDRGTGGWIVDYEAAGPYKDTLMTLFGDGLNIDLSQRPDAGQIEKKQALQEFLRAEGFTAPFAGLHFPWYENTEMAQAIDAMFTYSTSDWMITARHTGKWPYQNLNDLKAKIDHDPWLASRQSAHIILAHDQDELAGTVIALIRYMQDQGIAFADYPSRT